MGKRESIIALVIAAIAVVFFYSQNRQTASTPGSAGSGDPLPSTARTLASFPQSPGVVFPTPRAGGQQSPFYLTYNVSDAARIDEPGGDQEYLTSFLG